MAADRITVAVVDFHPIWGDSQDNLARIADLTTQAREAGADLVLFPETALSGYNTPDRTIAMQTATAVAADGPETARLAALAQQHGIYLVVGLPERDAASGKLYNSAFVAGPDGPVGCYRKMHPAGDESLWAAKGDAPLLLQTRWGPIGLAICYDVYQFPEVVRAYCAMGARLCLNATAVPVFPEWQGYYYGQLQARVRENGCFVASANLVGDDNGLAFPGGSHIVGPHAGSPIGTFVYAAPVEGEEGIRIATLDLSMVDASRAKLPVFTANRLTGEPDWRLDTCENLLAQVRAYRSSMP